jgi:hypothetical protein
VRGLVLLLAALAGAPQARSADTPQARSADTTPARAADTLVDQLERRLARGGVDALNAHLLSRASTEMLPLHQQTAACRRSAVSLTVLLGRGRDARAAGAHGDALRAAAGRCPGYVMALLTPQEVTRLCTPMASWGPATAARELRRRIAAIDAEAHLRDSARGQACRAAYHHELHHTRVVVKRALPAARPAGS